MEGVPVCARMRAGTLPGSWARVVYFSSDVRLGNNSFRGSLPSDWLTADAAFTPAAPLLTSLQLT